MRISGVQPVLIVMFLSLASLAGEQAAGVRGRPELYSKAVTDFLAAGEADEVEPRIRATPESPLRINQPLGVGVEIMEASVKTVKRNPRFYSTDESISNYATDHLAQLYVRLRNNTTKTIVVISLRFYDPHSESHFYIRTARGPIQAGAIEQVRIPLMATSYNPASLMVDVVRVTFADQPTWEEPASSRSVIARQSLHNPEVDQKPRPLNRLRADYTELARANQVSGVVRLNVTVSADGNVRKVEVMHALPDGLTEVAIKVARVLQFQPAKSKGSPVAYIVPLDVEFHLK